MELQPTSIAKVTLYWPLMAAAIWLGVATAGMWWLWHYSVTPGIAAQAAKHWPSDTKIKLSPTGDTLVMFAHPHCPCTRASIGELARIIAQCKGVVTPWIVFYKPAGTEANWEQTDLWSTALEIPGAHVVSDPQSGEARRFDATTSGQTFLYGPAGDLLFTGGITASRGHAGDNPGETSIVELVRGAAASCRHTSVFGCPIIENTNSN